ncbi:MULTISPECIES: N-acetylmuramic acid 6-phosphate etherase [Flavobacteriaceae]|uniref:N-acetylmuramic acid 6-phosphate etherase n=2 Tax=Flavobacteriaceae TaxID=49546 RepID=A0A4Y8AT97_9FLAO|nr:MULTISPECIES: N-acetylmuramic acid 6-phosphate etherase [Flavobacteriaceae]TEW75097.1 N-acetylmuramic acid 6-phosphate etherase [Gramella jeungdoensis]GGK41597.1 N-acetylmuramic acid 6-phosphate etherase [Lutibacter litoralis]
MKNKPTTEQASNYNNLEKMSTLELLSNINNEDKTVPYAVEKTLPSIERLVDAIYTKMKNGGRLFYIGAGTSGRLGVLDASECPPTFGVPDNWVIGLIAGGDFALRKAVENAEDNTTLAWEDLQNYNISDKDVLVGIAASGTTPYVIGGLETAKKNGIITGCIVCNTNSPVAKVADLPIEIVVGPEFVTGSTRMKSGTAQKLVLNMITTSVMIKLGRVKDNKMVHMQLSNAKLVNRGVLMLMDELHIDQELAASLLNQYKSVKNALDNYKI